MHSNSNIVDYRMCPLVQIVDHYFLKFFNNPVLVLEGIDFELYLRQRQHGIGNILKSRFERIIEPTDMSLFEQNVYLMFALSLFDLTLFKFVVKHNLCGARAELLRQDATTKSIAMGSYGKLASSYSVHLNGVCSKWLMNGDAHYAHVSFLRYYDTLVAACLNDYKLMDLCLRNVRNVYSLSSLPINTPFIHIRSIKKNSSPLRFTNFFKLAFLSIVPHVKSILDTSSPFVLVDFANLENGGRLELATDEERAWLSSLFVTTTSTSPYTFNQASPNAHVLNCRRFLHFQSRSPSIVELGTYSMVELRHNEQLWGRFMFCNVSLCNSNLFRLTRRDQLLVQNSGSIYLLDLLSQDSKPLAYKLIARVPSNLVFCQFSDDYTYVCFDPVESRYVRQMLPLTYEARPKTYLFRPTRFKRTQIHTITEYLQSRNHPNLDMTLQFFQTSDIVFFCQSPLVGGTFGKARVFVCSNFLLILK